MLPTVRPPADDAFADGDDFLVAPDIEAIGEMLRERHNLPVEPRIAYRWKRSGGEKGGLATRGWCQKLSGPAKHFSGAHFLVWLAADTCREAKYTQDQYVALLFHELSFVGVDYDKHGDPKFVMRRVDFEGFIDEVKFYGLWEDNLANFAAAAEQAPLWPMAGTKAEDAIAGGFPRDGVSSVTLRTGKKSVTFRTRKEIGEDLARYQAAQPSE